MLERVLRVGRRDRVGVLIITENDKGREYVLQDR
jgi:hypothetical protein